MSARNTPGDQPPRRIMVVSCPELHRANSRADSRADSTPDSRADPGADPGPETARRHERMVTIVTGFCPDVEIVEPGVCAFGARGPARYFGGETALATRIIAALADPSIQAVPAPEAGPSTQAGPSIQAGPGIQVGVADGLFAALLAARSQQHGTPEREDQVTVVPPGGTARFLASQPVSVLADRDLARLLDRLGLGTLGDFAALPARDVASRFGDPGECAHRLARGLDSRPLDSQPAARRPVRGPGVRPAGTAGRAGGVRGQGARRPAARRPRRPRADLRPRAGHGHLDGRAGEQQAVAARRPALRGRRGRTSPLATRRLAPRRRQHEPETNQEAPGGIAALRLHPNQVVRATGQQLALWGEATISDRVARAALRVQALLGHEAVLRPVPGGGRNVDDQVTPVPFGEKREPRLAADRPWPGRVMGPAPGLVFPAARAGGGDR